MKKVFVVAGLGVAVAVGGIFYLAQEKQEIPGREIQVGGVTLVVEVVDTLATRQHGLSGRDSLPENHGMLFVFEREGVWGIWMKDMQFSLDIIWADSEGDIITITRDVSPETYPAVFYPARAEARYVLELPAGYTKTHGIVEGMQIVLE